MQLERTLGITYKSAWFMSHRIREAMKDVSGGLREKLGYDDAARADLILKGAQGKRLTYQSPSR